VYFEAGVKRLEEVVYILLYYLASRMLTFSEFDSYYVDSTDAKQNAPEPLPQPSRMSSHYLHDIILIQDHSYTGKCAVWILLHAGCCNGTPGS
jgi:hypothetical protein